MKFEITQSPNSYLLLELNKNEKIIIEKGCLIYSDGEYDFENKIELESYKNIVSKIFGGKSLTYNIYTAKEELKMGFSAKDNKKNTDRHHLVTIRDGFVHNIPTVRSIPCH